MKAPPARKCLCCLEKFHPDARNRRHQQYCSKDGCRKASKSARQARWLAKEENRDYFRGEANTERVRQWRAAHPGYWRRKASAAADALQDDSNPQPVGNEPVAPPVPPAPPGALQDVCLLQPALLVGLISVVTGHALQDDIAASARSFLVRGRDILRMVPGSHDIADYEKHRPPMPRTAAPRAPAVQLD
jgi:hypothetical protein